MIACPPQLRALLMLLESLTETLLISLYKRRNISPTKLSRDHHAHELWNAEDTLRTLRTLTDMSQ